MSTVNAWPLAVQLSLAVQVFKITVKQQLICVCKPDVVNYYFWDESRFVQYISRIMTLENDRTTVKQVIR